MAGFADYEAYDAVGLAELVRRGKVTPGDNITGQLALLPLGQVPTEGAARGLPLAVQLVGRYGDEATVFRLAAQLEQARPWSDRKPALAEREVPR